MARALDGTALHSYCRRLEFDGAAQAVLRQIRDNPPSRTPQARRGNVVVSYPSRKMGLVIKSESHKVEFACLLQYEHDPDVLELYDQPPAIPLQYADRRGYVQNVRHTPDYFVFRYATAGWVECKTENELQRLAVKQPNRFQLDDSTGQWRCPPGEAYAAQYGLQYQVFSSDSINWTMQDNWQYLDDYYQFDDTLSVPENELTRLSQLVAETPGINLADLVGQARDVSRDHINIAISRGLLYIDLTQYRLSDQSRTHIPVYSDQESAIAYAHRVGPGDSNLLTQTVLLAPNTQISWDGKSWRIGSVGDAEITIFNDQDEPFSMKTTAFETLVRQGRIVGIADNTAPPLQDLGVDRLQYAGSVEMARALARDRIIHPEFHLREELRIRSQRATQVCQRTKRRWRARERRAQLAYGNGFVGLLSDYGKCGRPRLDEEHRKLIEEVLASHYTIPTRPPRRGAYGEYLLRCEERGFKEVSATTFYSHAKRYKDTYARDLARGGRRYAYPAKSRYRSDKRELNVNGDYAWAHAYMDHTQLDLRMRYSQTGQDMGRPWLSICFLGNPRRVASFTVSYDPPNAATCLTLLRLCVRRFGRVPASVTVDGGPEFGSIAFEIFLAVYRIRKCLRPASEPRFGSPQERVLGTFNTEFLYHLLGNTQASREPRKLSSEVDPKRLGVWTLPSLAARCRIYFEETYDTRSHPALQGQTPRAAYERSMLIDGTRDFRLIPYTQSFIMSTWPIAQKQKVIAQPGVGVHINYEDYWCEELRDKSVERTLVEVRYDPLDITQAAAYIGRMWRPCKSPIAELAGCSGPELELLAAEYRQTQKLMNSAIQVNITQKHLARFRRENAASEVLLARQRKDAENRAAYQVLEGAAAGVVADEPRQALGGLSAASSRAPGIFEAVSSQTAQPGEPAPPIPTSASLTIPDRAPIQLSVFRRRS